MRFLFSLFFVAFTFRISAFSVLVIGAGPSGLATAIEAWQSGAEVTIVEKRSAYLRDRAIFLRQSSLRLLDQWKVTVPEMRHFKVGDNKVGLILIYELERALAKRVKELGIEIVQGQFKDFDEKSKSAIVEVDGERREIGYDILVGADGYHSTVRDKLEIPYRFMGRATAAFTETKTNETKTFGIMTSKQNGMFIRRFNIPPHHCVILAQTISGNEQITPHQLARAAWNAGWYRDAEDLYRGKALFFINQIDVVLQQSIRFSDEEQGALIVGDAAAVASFFQSMGANFAFKSAAIAGRFFKNLQEESPYAYYFFNQQMDEISDQLILDSLYLFGL